MSILQKLLQEADICKEKASAANDLTDEAQKMIQGLKLSDVYDYMLSQAHHAELDVSDTMILNLHRMLLPADAPPALSGYRSGPAEDPGTGRTPPDAEDVPRLMGHLSDQILSSCAGLHPVELAAMAHKRLMDIQPFLTGNQACAELLMNLILVHYGYGVTLLLPAAGQTRYMKALAESVQLYDMEPFALLCAECVAETGKQLCG